MNDIRPEGGDEDRDLRGFLIEKTDWQAGAIFILIALVLISLLPLLGALPGNCDTWLSMAVSRGWLQLAESYVSHGEVYSAMHPSGAAVLFGESAPGAATAFLILDAFLPLEWAVAWLVGLFLAGSSWGVYLLCRSLGVSVISAMVAGYLFSTSNFVFANLDDSIVLFWLLPALAIREFILPRSSSSRGYLWACVRSAVLFGVQLYFSLYVFLIGLIAVLGMMVGRAVLSRRELGRWGFVRGAAISGLVGLVMAAPWLWLYLTIYASDEFLNPFLAASVSKLCSIALQDLFAVLPGNILRGSETQDWGLFWSEVRRYAYLGATPLILGVVGVVSWGRRSVIPVFLMLVGALLAVAPTTSRDPQQIQTLVTWLQERFELLLFLRVPLRGYFLTSIGLCIVAGMGLDSLFGRLKPRRAVQVSIVVALVLFHAVDNVPRDVAQYRIADLTRAPAGLVDFGDRVPEAVVAQFPSNLGLDFLDSEQQVFRYSRELIYFLWQQQHGLRTVNGVNGYLSFTRAEVERAYRTLNDEELLELLSTEFGVTHVVIHRNSKLSLPRDGMFLHRDRSPGQRFEGVDFRGDGCLEREVESSEHVEIYRIEPPACYE